MIRIIQAELPEQIEQARRLFLEYAESLGFSLCFQDFDKELAELPGKYAPPAGRLLLAYVDEAPAGCIALHRLSSADTPVCEMKRLYVRPAFRGHGLGKKLIDRLLSEGKVIGYQRMRLDTIVGKMDSAIAIYREYGFREIPSYCENPVHGALYMELDLETGPA